jgi:hypothetical protein
MINRRTLFLICHVILFQKHRDYYDSHNVSYGMSALESETDLARTLPVSLCRAAFLAAQEVIESLHY